MTNRLDRGVGISRFYPYGDDLKLLESFREPNVARKLMCIKHNDPSVKGLELLSSVLDTQAWRLMGCILGRSRYIDELMIQNCHQVDLAGLCVGLKMNTCINPSLKDIVLIGCNLGQASIDVLTDALLGRRIVNSMESINIIYNHWANVDLDCFVLALNKCTDLKSLGLSFNGIGRRACTSLAALLSNPESNLEHLYVGHNSIDDECMITITHSLLENTNLKCLGLDGNNAMSNQGWSAMVNLVYNSGSIKEVLESNHTLCDLKCLARDTKAAERALGLDKLRFLRAALKMNAAPNKALVARRKILWSYAQGDLSIDDLPVSSGTLPRVLSLIGDNSDKMNANFIQFHHPLLVKTEVVSLNMMYNILRLTNLLYEV